MDEVEPGLHMWLTLALTGAALIAYAQERLPTELTSIGVIAVLLLGFHLFPLPAGEGVATLDADILLRGFANPAMIAVAALLVVGQAMVNTGALESLAHRMVRATGARPKPTFAFGFGSVIGMSAVLNNTPVVVIFIPIMRSLAERFARPVGSVMIPLSYCAILGGMITLIGSSSNLLVSGELVKLGQPELDFFDITVPGLVLAACGAIYVMIVGARTRSRADDSPGIVSAGGKQFIAELDITDGSPLIGETSRAGMFAELPGVTVRLVQRRGRVFLPPFEDLTLLAGDILIVAATRKVLTDMLAAYPGQLLATGENDADGGARPVGGGMLTEVMVVPASRMVGLTLDLTNFSQRSGCMVLGIQRRARMLRSRLGNLRLEPGDVLLIMGDAERVRELRGDPDIVLLGQTSSELPQRSKAPLAGLIFAGIVLPAAFDLVPIVTTALFGVIALVVTGCINIRQAARAIDRKIVLVIAAALALATALQATGGTNYLAGLVIGALDGASPTVVISAFFLLVAAMTNILSNNACAVLFTPIALHLALRLEADPFPFALAVLFAANCSFATPFGYQTNLLVMGPGNHRFGDFVRAGLPLILVIWLAFTLFVPWYYDL